MRREWNIFGRLRFTSRPQTLSADVLEHSSTHIQAFRPVRVLEASMRTGTHDVQEFGRLT